MNQVQLIEILSAHADSLNDGMDNTESIVGAHPTHQATLKPLLTLAQQVKANLVPVPLPAQFVDDLGAALQAGTVVPMPEVAPRNHISLLLAATIGSLLSLVGIIVVLRRRHREVAPMPA